MVKSVQENIMGKDNLIIGTARGKLGDIIFYRTGGEQRFRTRVRPTNPRTNAQLVQRCIVSTVVKAYSDFVTVCDHAFQDYTGKLKNHQRYMRLNIMAFRPVALSQVARWSPILWSYTARNYNWARKDDTNTYVNPYILSEGDLQGIAIANFANKGFPAIATKLSGSATTWTWADVANALGVNIGDQLTFITQWADNKTGAVTRTEIARIVLMPSNGEVDEPMFAVGESESKFIITNPNKEDYGYLRFMQNETGDIAFMQDATTTGDNVASSAVIVSRFENNIWKRSNSIMSVKTQFRNLSSLESAVASYLKSDTSSLYLNQATNGERQALEVRNIDLLSDETDMYGMTIAEDEEKSTKRKK